MVDDRSQRKMNGFRYAVEDQLHIHICRTAIKPKGGRSKLLLACGRVIAADLDECTLTVLGLHPKKLKDILARESGPLTVTLLARPVSQPLIFNDTDDQRCLLRGHGQTQGKLWQQA